MVDQVQVVIPYKTLNVTIFVEKIGNINEN